MRLSHHFGLTLRAAGDDEVAGQRFLLRAGYVRQLAAGIFSYLPAGWRALRRVEQIVREEMDRIGAEELSMPVVHPAELWQKTGRWYEIGPELLRMQDRGGRDMVLAMTHEEVVTDLAHREIESWRQLPMAVYQIQTKFRDEPRARAGLIRCREFTMKDSYSFDRDEAGLHQVYARHYTAYSRMFQRMGLRHVVAVSSDVGMMGGKLAHEFMLVADIGEDTLVLCDSCGFAANQQVAQFRKPGVAEEAPLPMERVATPATATIAALAALLEVPESRTAKMVFFEAGVPAGDRLVAAVIRGDLQVNETKLANLVGARWLRPATEDLIRSAGMVPGYASPLGVTADTVIVVVDDSVQSSPNLVGGANEVGFHVRNMNPGRDFRVDRAGDIASAPSGAPCTSCGNPLRLVRGVELGNIFQLGTRYSDPLQATFIDEHGTVRSLWMGSYGVGIGRALACIAEVYHDERGLTLPVSVAPYLVHIVVLGADAQPREIAERLEADLETAGVSVMYDDREASAGVKFADADLLGAPLRVTVSPRSLAAGGLEVRARVGGDTMMLPVEGAAVALAARLQAMLAELEATVQGISLSQ